jgi:hypothetical protein
LGKHYSTAAHTDTDTDTEPDSWRIALGVGGSGIWFARVRVPGAVTIHVFNIRISVGESEPDEVI